MAGKGILRKNRAAHYKSQLNARLRAQPPHMVNPVLSPDVVTGRRLAEAGQPAAAAPRGSAERVGWFGASALHVQSTGPNRNASIRELGELSPPASRS